MKFYWLQSFAVGSQCIWFREKLLPEPVMYFYIQHIKCCKIISSLDNSGKCWIRKTDSGSSWSGESVLNITSFTCSLFELYFNLVAAPLAFSEWFACYSVMLMPSLLWRCWLGGRKGIRPVKTEWWGVGVVICLEWGADLHMFQLMPLPLSVSSFGKIQIGFAFLVPTHLDSPGIRAIKRVCVCVCVCVL